MSARNFSQKLLLTAFALVLVSGLGASQAFAQTEQGISSSPGPLTPQVAVTTDELWHEFLAGTVGNFAVDCAGGCQASTGTPSVDAGNPPWTFTCNAPDCWLSVTDAFLQDGEQFEIFDFGASVGTTSVGGPTGQQCAPNDTDPEDCFADPDSASGMFNLAAGAHSITIQTIAGTTVGAAYFKIDQHDVVGGEFLPIDTTALLIAGAQTNAVWIMSALAVIGSIAFGALYITSKKN